MWCVGPQIHIHRFNISAAARITKPGGTPQVTNYLGALDGTDFHDPIYNVPGYFRLPSQSFNFGRQLRVVVGTATNASVSVSVCVPSQLTGTCAGGWVIRVLCLPLVAGSVPSWLPRLELASSAQRPPAHL